MTQGNAVLIAGGGAGSAPSVASVAGAGGGESGQAGTIGGTGGTPVFGRSGAPAYGGCLAVAGDGAGLTGGDGGGDGGMESIGGGGGGGGSIGGGGGGCADGGDAHLHAGSGGGGSAYVSPSLTGGSTVAGTNGQSGGGVPTTAQAPHSSEPQWGTGIGRGGGFDVDAFGGMGLVTFLWEPAPTITGPAPASTITNTARPVASGTGLAGHLVTVREGSQILCTAVVQSDNLWSCRPTVDLPDGSRTYSATQRRNVTGAPESGPVTTTFTLSVPAPPAPTILTPTEGSVTNDRTPDFTGTGQPGATVTVRKGAQVLCTAVVASSGSWSCTSTVELPFGSQGVTARQAALGRDSVDSALRTFDVAIRVIGVVAKDANRSGTATSGERNLVGIDVQLWSNGVDGLPQTGDDVLVATVTTTASGFEFPSVLPGKYTLRLVPATIAQGLYPTNDTDGGSNRIVALDLSSYGLAASPASPASTGPVIVSAYFGEMYAGINVLVTDSNGTPIRNAAVVFTDSAGHVFQGVTDGSGRLVIDGNESQWMALGAGSLTVRTADGRQVVQTVSVGAGTPVQAVATIPGDALIGDLPETGSHVAELVWVGGLAVAAGALLLLGRQQLGRQQFGRRRLGRRG